MALYSRQYPRGCVIMDAEGVIAAIGELRGSVALEAIVRAHYTAAQEAIAAGQVREFIASEADAAKTGMLKTDASQRPARAGSLR